MKIVIIILVFILIFLNTSIQLDIENIEISNSKVKYKAKIKLFIFKVIQIIQIKVKKKMLKQLVKIIDMRRIRESKTVKKIKPKIKRINLKIDYGLKNVFLNIYLYSFINAVIALILSNNEITNENREYKISTNFDKNYFKANLKLQIEIILKDIIFKNNGHTKNKKGGIQI